jgi:hypothetical protein
MKNQELLSQAITAYESKSYKVAFSSFKKLVKDNAAAAYYLGLMYYHGYFIDNDDSMAFKYFKQAWEGLYKEGIFMLGRLYEEGRGTEKDLEQAFKLYQAVPNSDQAKLRLANFYEYGKFVNKNLPEAIKIYNELQKNNNPYAMYKIGYFYLKGEGLKQDLNNAYKWLNKALLAGSIEAMNHFRLLDTKSKSDIRTKEEIFKAGLALLEKRQIEDALPYFEVAAKEKHLESVLKLYEIYQKGLVVAQDYNRAYEILFKYQSYNKAEIYYLLGYIFENGQGVDSSFIKAANYYELAAKLNHDKATQALMEIRGY